MAQSYVVFAGVGPVDAVVAVSRENESEFEWAGGGGGGWGGKRERLRRRVLARAAVARERAPAHDRVDSRVDGTLIAAVVELEERALVAHG